jgi:predicted porin
MFRSARSSGAYEIADDAGSDQVDQRLKEGASAEYYFNPYTSVYARYEHTDFFSAAKASDFLRNELRIGMRIRH